MSPENENLQNAVLKTLCYSDIFDFPLTYSEICRFFIYRRQVSPQTIKKTLSILVADKKIVNSGGYYFLPGKKEIVDRRHICKTVSFPKLQIALKTAGYLKLINSVQGIAITGALAMRNTDLNDDIDLMLITSGNRLWLTRIITVLLISLLGKRRKPSASASLTNGHKNQICLNLFLDLNHLQVPQNKQNLYTAHEVTQAKFIYSKNSTAQLFLFNNSWINEFLPNFHIPNPQQTGLYSESNSTHPCHISLFIFLEKLAYWLQLKYMKKRVSQEIISPNQAFFHPRNTGEKVLKRYAERLKINII